MSNRVFDPALTSGLLLQTWRDGTLLDELPAALRPETLQQGYEAQDALFAATGDERGGWKLGVGSPAQLRATGLPRPLVGQIARGRCHASGASLTLPSADPVTIECEIAFVLARDIAPAEGRQVQAQDIRHSCVTFEVVRSRFRDRRAAGWPSFTADNVGFEALIIGQAVCNGLDLDAIRRVTESAVVLVDGQIKAQALSGDNAVDPVQSLTALFAHAAERGVTLRAGDIVSTGAMCQPFDIPGAGHRITASFAGGELALQLL
ncbi:2-keto-4-pentenoate hydratase [Bordetella avium]|uniref:Hydratase n=1 Tax=Bordetella avium (strain 197N) TaxID=360910 RepID=Q2L1M5_BORA1|nr:fumarylacetoacetate hydrolase family protein [Bordetella avium]AZY48998.1 hydratase [Bordetella avium]AZY52358.1 hydratase [Bordetella avium]RIQ14242.1 hydratase [Bordetella avium]RIQ18116.1 hydratase [Bordetella avium]RIQ36588.1 hydratase [Bordetella avium]